MIDRRSFLKLFGISGAVAVAAGAAVAHKDALETLLSDGEYRVSMTRQAIGTHVDITAIGSSHDKTEDAVNAAFSDVAAMEKLLTRYDNMSPVAELNAEGRVLNISEPLAELFSACSFFNRDTEGAFDITVKPLLDLMQACAKSGRQPTESEIADVLPHIGASRMIAKENALALEEGMGITFDGAAPGFIADRAAKILESFGIENYLVNAGGEIRTAGHPKGAESWRIAIQDPAKKGNYPGFLAMNKGAVSTSGNYEIFYGADRVFHHIVDARSGHSPALSSVTVTAPTALEADILSTALFVMTPQQALDYVAKRRQFACLILDNDGNRIMSPNFILA